MERKEEEDVATAQQLLPAISSTMGENKKHAQHTQSASQQNHHKGQHKLFKNMRREKLQCDT